MHSISAGWTMRAEEARMSPHKCLALVLVALTALNLGACTGLQRSDPLQVAVAGIEPLQGEGRELRMIRQAFAMTGREQQDKSTYRLSGKLNGPGFASKRFQAQGELELPQEAGPAGEPAQL